MNDRFDKSVSELLDPMPPEDISGRVGPFSLAIGRITKGLWLSLFYFNFLWLQVLMPAAGAALLYLGFRTLRRGNRSFRACYILSLCQLPLLVLTVLEEASGMQFGAALTAANCICRLLLFFFYGVGLHNTAKRAGCKTGVELASVSAVLWYLTILVIAKLGVTGSLIPLAMLLWFGFAVSGLTRSAKRLDAAGYALESASVRMPGWLFSLIWAMVLVCTVLAGCLGLARTPLKAETYEPCDSSHLTALGVPEKIASALSPEDSARLGECVRLIPTEYGSSPYYDTDSFELGYLPGTAETTLLIAEKGYGAWLVLSYFEWTESPGPSFEDAMRLNVFEDFQIIGVSGLLLWDKDGESFRAEAPELFFGTRSSNSIFFGERQSMCADTKFSFPYGSENRRGYMLTEIEYTGGSGQGDYALAITFELYARDKAISLPYSDPLDSTGGNRDRTNAQAYSVFRFELP